jgi:tRNA (mo5U34)-methyltransferase
VATCDITALSRDIERLVADPQLPAPLGEVACAHARLRCLRMRTPTAEEAREVCRGEDIIWHQAFELAPGVSTPGTNNVLGLANLAGLPTRLSGESVLDIGTTNGGFAFELERRGAGRVVAVDIFDADFFGFAAVRELLDSRAEFIQGSIYELPSVLEEQFDIVLFLGVLYHLRHPLLALDNVRALTRGQAYIESAVCDSELPQLGTIPGARFYRRDELSADPSNWFAPNVAALVDFCGSSGLEPTRVRSWPDGSPTRALVAARPVEGKPEFEQLSYERPLVPMVQKPAGV